MVNEQDTGVQTAPGMEKLEQRLRNMSKRLKRMEDVICDSKSHIEQMGSALCSQKDLAGRRTDGERAIRNATNELVRAQNRYTLGLDISENVARLNQLVECMEEIYFTTRDTQGEYNPASLRSNRR